jgi:hypothetical protein
MKQLGIAGGIEWTTTRSTPQLFEFQASRPGHSYRIKADVAQRRVTLHRDDLNVWGVMHVLHTFTGVASPIRRISATGRSPAYGRFCMDAVAVGLIVMVFSSYYMWYALIRKRVLGYRCEPLGFRNDTSDRDPAAGTEARYPTGRLRASAAPSTRPWDVP